MPGESRRTDPIRPADEEARALARELLEHARHGALGVIDPQSGAPFVTRIAVARDADGTPLTLISALAQHTAALRSDPRASLLLGEPGPRGDPLTHPRITLAATARFLPRPSAEHDAARARYLAQQPKAKLYIDFADFSLLRLEVCSAFLNAGFGKAYALTPADLGLGGGG